MLELLEMLLQLPNMNVDTVNAQGETLVWHIVQAATEAFRMNPRNQWPIRELLEMLVHRGNANINHQCGDVSLFR
jgi:competence protein ComGC